MHMPGKGDYAYHANVGLQNKCRKLERENKELKSGEAFQREAARTEKWRQRFERECAARKSDARKADRERNRAIKLWMEVADDEYNLRLKAEENAGKWKAEAEAAREKIEALEKELKDAKDHIASMEHQLGRNSANSSIPSSKDPVHKPAPSGRHNNNSRGQSEKKRGAQEDHAPQPRRMLEPTEEAVPCTDQPTGAVGDEWYMTGEFVRKLLVGIRIELPVTPYMAAIWKSRKTGKTLLSPLPYGIHDEISYAPELKAFVHYMTQNLNVAARKVKDFLYEATDGKLEVSHGWIAQLSREFHAKSPEEREAVAKKLVEAISACVDSTVTKNDGKRETISVACSKDAAYFTHTQRKGKDAVNSLPIAPSSGFSGIGISDREITLLEVGTEHQICLSHLLRDLTGIEEMEPGNTWSPLMQGLFREMIHASHDWDADHQPSTEAIAKWEAEYDRIIALGRAEHVKNPPSKYFLKGYDLRMTLKDYKHMVLCFLRHPGIVPPTSNDAERCLRQHKRKLAQVTTFRSGDYLDYHCSFLTLAVTARKRGEFILNTLVDIFSKDKGAIAVAAGKD